jgi:DNA-binding NarL/FixJ family response regulator
VALRILVVDDNYSCAHAIRLLLERQGTYVVGTAYRSAEAVELTHALRPDVVLIDLMLGDECGLDLAELLAQARGGDAPAIIMTSGYSAADVVELIATSPAAAGFLPKSDLSADAIRQIIGTGHSLGGDALPPPYQSPGRTGR